MSAEEIPPFVEAASHEPRLYVAAEVRAAAARKGLNQRAIARLLGVSHTAINRRWKGKTAWDADELIIISAATGVPAAQFMPPLDFDPSGPLAQLVELRTFNPKSQPSLRLLTFPTPRTSHPQVPGNHLRVVADSP